MVQHILAEKYPYHPQMLLQNLLEKFQKAIALMKMELITFTSCSFNNSVIDTECIDMIFIVEFYYY